MSPEQGATTPDFASGHPQTPGGGSRGSVELIRLMLLDETFDLAGNGESEEATKRTLACEVIVDVGGHRSSGATVATFLASDAAVKAGPWERLEAALLELDMTFDASLEKGLERFRERVAHAVRARGKLSVVRKYQRGSRPAGDTQIGRMATQAIHGAMLDALSRHWVMSGQEGPGPASIGEPGDALLRPLLDHVERYLCVPPPPPPTVNGLTLNGFSDAEFIGALPKDGTKGHLLEREALAFGLNSERFPNGSFVVTDANGTALNFKWGRSPIASGVSLVVCSYKEATRALLSKIGVPVPLGRSFPPGDTDAVVAYARGIGYPVVCKPVAGLRGIGVVSGIRNEKELRSALRLIEKSEMGGDDLIVERHVSGEDYRIVIVGGRLVAAVRRDPASVTGDGKHTILDLIEYKNRKRLENPHLRSRPIKLSEGLRYQLERAGLDLRSVPEVGRKVILANSANLSQGGDSIEVTGELHPTIRDAALRAVEAVPGLGFCGLDMLLEDHRRPIDEQNATIIELNAHAAIGSAQYPAVGEPQPVARDFFLECARRYGVQIRDEPAPRIAVEMTVKGRVTGVNYRAWLQRRAERFGLGGWVRNVASRRVQAHVEGPTDAVAALCYLAIRGPRRAVPTSVSVELVDEQGYNAFKQAPTARTLGPSWARSLAARIRPRDRGYRRMTPRAPK